MEGISHIHNAKISCLHSNILFKLSLESKENKL